MRYRSGGRPRISVTQVLTLAGRIDGRWFTEESRARGTAVHRLTEVFDRGEALSIPPGCEGYIDAYAEFVTVVRPVYLASELTIIDNDLELAGTIDRVCADLFGWPGILDFKTGVAAPWHGLQLAAYNVLRPTGLKWACYLQANGKYKLRQYDDPQDHRKFMYDLACTQGRVTIEGDYWKAA